MGEKGHIIMGVSPGSIAEEMEIESGDILLEINGEEIEDIFDYQFLAEDDYIEVLIRKPNQEEWLLEIEKDCDEEIGITFENGLMDEYKTCHNQCIFCFIDQMPPGMRETLYFKDDDSRLSFLQGNYVTLTNMSDKDIARIIKYHLAPINISFQTTNPQLRCEMLHNRFAGEALQKVDLLYQAGIEMNGQIVLCKGVNDKEELERSIRDLTNYLPHLTSVSVVPVGLSKYREGLYTLEPFTKADAGAVLQTIHTWQKKLYEEHGTHFIHASDEWYVLAEQELPEEDTYDGYLQLENGVGMMRLLQEEFKEELKYRYHNRHKPEEQRRQKKREEVTLATGQLAYPYLKDMAEQVEELYPQMTVHVYPIKNVFFGEQITVSGLLTGQDIKEQLMGKPLGTRLLLPQNVLRSGETVFLDDYTVEDLEKALQVKIDIVKSSGRDFIEAIQKE
ncbi:MAG: DUF512 domain-containing protein [Lachnospiraceae bacterium]